MKRMLVLVLALAMVLAAVSASALTWATVSNPNAADRLNLRAKPSQDAISYGKYYNGTQVQILSGPSNGWYHVRVGTGNGIGELEGYMMAKYLVTGERAGQTQDMRPTVTLKSRDGSRMKLLNFFDGSCMGRVDSGTRATVLGVGTKYIHVVTEDGSTGFIEAELAEPRLFFSDTDDAASNATATWATVSNPNAADRLNLRAKPSQDAISYGKYYNGTQVQILSGPSNGWYHVRVGTGNGIGELEGYMMAKYLVTGERAGQTRDMRPTVTLKSRDGSRMKLLNFFDGSCMGRVDSGTRATVLGVGTKYIHVVTEDGSTGFIEAELAEPRLFYAQP